MLFLQVMAIATLARCYNNHGVFTGVVKIRKGEACSLMMQAVNMEQTLDIFQKATFEVRYITEYRSHCYCRNNARH